LSYNITGIKQTEFYCKHSSEFLTIKKKNPSFFYLCTSHVGKTIWIDACSAVVEGVY